MSGSLQRKNYDNKGFSLIELIIVVAIMGILIAVLAPQFIRYVEKSKIGKDTEVAGVVQQAINVAMADPSIPDRPLSFGPTSLDAMETVSSMPQFTAAVKEYIGASSLGAFQQDNIKSKSYGGQKIIVEIDANTELVEVTVHSNFSGVDDIVVK